MSSRRRAIVLGVLALATLQLVFWLVYRALEGSGSGDELWKAEIVRADESVVTLESLEIEGPVLLHFWATWCEPCREELPTLEALARSSTRPHGLRVVLVSLDEDWAPVRTFFAGAIPAHVVRDPEQRLTAWLGVTTLPDTYFFDAGRAQRARFHGPRDWTSALVQDELARAISP